MDSWGLGLILPGLTKIQPNLTVLTAFGLVVVMVVQPSGT